MSLLQRPVGPFWDFDIFAVNRKQRSTRFQSQLLYRLQMLVEMDGELRFGGVDDIYEQIERDGEDDEDEEDLFAIHPSHLTMRHRFFGTVEVQSRDELTERGCSLLKQAGADLSTLEEGGVIHVRIRAIFHHYETSSFTQDNGTWIRSNNGSKDNPKYLSYRVASHDRATYQRCRITRERFWWLEFVRYCCDQMAKGKRPADKRTIPWLVRCYMETFPTHQSGVHPPSDGPPKNTQRGEVHLALARNADFIHRKLKTTNPRPMNLPGWPELKRAYNKSSVSREKLYECASENEKESVSDEEDKDDDGMDFELAVGPSARGTAGPVRGPSREFSREISLFGEPGGGELEGLETGFDDLEQPFDASKSTIVKHRPTLSPNFQYSCPFNSLVAGQNAAANYQCTFKIDLVRLTHPQILSLPRELRGLVQTSKTKFDNPTLSLLLAVLLDPHLVRHLQRRSGIQRVSAAYEVEVAIHPEATYLVDKSPAIYRRFDPESGLIRYRWVVEPGSDDDDVGKGR